MAKTKATEGITLAAELRKDYGSRVTRRLRKVGIVPGVIYGRDLKPISVSINRKEFSRLLHAKALEHALLTICIDGVKPGEHTVLVKALQHDPVDGRITHVDFHAVVLTERVRVKVSVVLKGEPVGVKQDGGLLEHFLRELEVECLPTEIPDDIEFDVNMLKIGDTIHVRDIPVPKNVKIISDPEGVIASVQIPKVEKVEELAPATATEPEVIREKKPEAEASTGEAQKGEASGAKKETKTEK